jgi:hypothetical protein
LFDLCSFAPPPYHHSRFVVHSYTSTRASHFG